MPLRVDNARIPFLLFGFFVFCFVGLVYSGVVRGCMGGVMYGWVVSFPL